MTVHCWGAEREPVAGGPAVARTGPGRRSPARGRTPRRSRRSRSTSRWPPASRARDLVHSHTWYANLGGHLAKLAARDPARRDGAQPRADAAVEGRAARRRLRRSRASASGRRSRPPTRSSRSRREHARATSSRCYPAIDPARVQRDPQRHRHRASTGPTAAPTCSSATASTRTGPSVVFVGRITRQKGARPPARRRAR